MPTPQGTPRRRMGSLFVWMMLWTLVLSTFGAYAIHQFPMLVSPTPGEPRVIPTLATFIQWYGEVRSQDLSDVDAPGIAALILSAALTLTLSVVVTRPSQGVSTEAGLTVLSDATFIISYTGAMAIWKLLIVMAHSTVKGVWDTVVLSFTVCLLCLLATVWNPDGGALRRNHATAAARLQHLVDARLARGDTQTLAALAAYYNRTSTKRFSRTSRFAAHFPWPVAMATFVLWAGLVAISWLAAGVRPVPEQVGLLLSSMAVVCCAWTWITAEGWVQRLSSGKRRDWFFTALIALLVSLLAGLSAIPHSYGAAIACAVAVPLFAGLTWLAYARSQSGKQRMLSSLRWACYLQRNIVKDHWAARVRDTHTTEETETPVQRM